MYDIASQTLTYFSDLNEERDMRPCVFLFDSKLYVAGGSTSNESYLQTMEYLDINSGSWHSSIDLPSPRDSITCVTTSDTVYLFGGNPGDINIPKSSFKFSEGQTT